MGAKAKADFGDIVIGGSLTHAGTATEEKVTLPTDRQPDFSGWATKSGIVCSDGRTIMPDAFKHQDMTKVPLVWQHSHDEPSNVLGHAILENRDQGVYAYGYFNETDPGKHAKQMVEHGDINSLSIYANALKEQAKKVIHGTIRELSLVLARANPGALIDFVQLAHGDGSVIELEDEAIIYNGLELKHGDEATIEHGDGSGDTTVQDVYDAMSDEQKEVVHFMVGAAVEGVKQGGSAEHSALSNLPGLPEKDDPTIQHNNGEGVRRMKRNVFETKNGGASGSGEEEHVLTHDAIKGIARDAFQRGSLKAAVEHYAIAHGIEDIDVLFPDAKTLTSTPEFDKRRTEWVSSVLSGVSKSPFSRVKSIVADLTQDQARAKGYIKGRFKKEEWFGLTKRVTTPTTFYKKQQLDRDDIIDITDFDVVAWLKAEMRLMLDEELARAILVGDGREVDDEDKIRDPQGTTEGAGIRSIANDHELYAATITVPAGLDTDAKRRAFVEQIMLDMRLYKGSGSPTFYTTIGTLNALLLTKDGMGRRLWRTASDLAAEMGISNIVTIEVMEDDEYNQLAGVIVNLRDYTIGTDRGGEVGFFDDFDIDYNQYKYLIEGRCSGGLTKIRSALVVRFGDVGDTLAAPEAPLFDPATGEVVINDTAGVVYTRTDTGAVVNTAGSPYVVAPGDALTIQANPDATHFFDNNVEDSWTFDRPA